MIRISIITPFYYGNAYMPAYGAMIRRNARAVRESELSDQLSLEVVLVNDSPDEKIQLWKDSDDSSVTVRLIENPKNQGIQLSRIHGLKEAKGDYIIFLDQDDILSDHAVLNFGREVIKNRGISDPYIFVANAVLEQKDWQSLWYRTDYHKKQIGKRKTYLNVGTQIISPGQCLLPVKWIPDFWISHPLTENGADDYFLWILLLEAGVKFHYIDQPLYIHHYTAKNLSGDTSVTDRSTCEFIEILEGQLKLQDTDSFPIGENLSLSVRQTISDLRLLRTMMGFKAAFRRGGKAEKLRQIIRHPILLLRNAYFKIRSKTAYGFNR